LGTLPHFFAGTPRRGWLSEGGLSLDFLVSVRLFGSQYTQLDRLAADLVEQCLDVPLSDGVLSAQLSG
jgi:hypothetical protein